MTHKSLAVGVLAIGLLAGLATAGCCPCQSAGPGLFAGGPVHQADQASQAPAPAAAVSYRSVFEPEHSATELETAYASRGSRPVSAGGPPSDEKDVSPFRQGRVSAATVGPAVHPPPRRVDFASSLAPATPEWAWGKP